MFQNNLTPPPKGPSQLNYHDSQLINNERNHLDSHFSFLKPLLEDFTFIYI